MLDKTCFALTNLALGGLLNFDMISLSICILQSIGENENKPKFENETHALWGRVQTVTLKYCFIWQKDHPAPGFAAEQSQCYSLTSQVPAALSGKMSTLLFT